jgi:hypothetical protein
MVTICYIYPLIHVTNVLKKKKNFLHSVMVSERTDLYVKFLIKRTLFVGKYSVQEAKNPLQSYVRYVGVSCHLRDYRRKISNIFIS